MSQDKWYMEDESIRELMNSFSSPWDRYRNHPAQIALRKWSDVQDFYHGIVIKNELLLLTYLNEPISNRKVRNKLLKNIGESAYRVEATRRLYNYISSISSLAEHTMKLIKEYEGSEFKKEYDNRLHKVTALEEYAFLKDLRNYVVHSQIPPIGYIIGTNKLLDRNEAFLPVIYTGDLFDYDGWSSGSKQYLKNNFPEIELIRLVDVYAQAINELYVWMFAQFKPIHEKDIEDSEKVKQSIIDGQVG